MPSPDDIARREAAHRVAPPRAAGDDAVIAWSGTHDEASRRLAQPADRAQRARNGDQTGGRAGHFLSTGDFGRDHAAMTAAGVDVLETPRVYGTQWDMQEPAA